MADLTCKLLIIGAGPGGYVCAIRAGQLGIDTIVVEKEKAGGTCLNVGCIPSKAIIHAADEFFKMKEAAQNVTPIGLTNSNPQIDFAKTLEWKDGIVTRLNSGVSTLMKKANTRFVNGHVRFVDGKKVEVKTADGTQAIEAEKIVIATGSRPIELPFLPFSETVCSSTDLLSVNKIPERLVVVGGGYIGLELGSAFAKLGSKVTIVEAADRILPQYDAALTKPVVARLSALGVSILTKTRAKEQSRDAKSLHVEDENGDIHEIGADKLLVTVGRQPVTDGIGLNRLAVDMDGEFIKVDDRCQTSMRGIYAIGDVTGEPMLAHRAMAQGEMVAEIVAGENRDWDKQCIPAICFTDPEIVSVGLTPDEVKQEKIDVKTGLFPFSASGRAMTTEREDGFVRVVARADNHVVLGIQAVGENVSELAASFALAIEMAARLEDIAGTIHAHPSRGEALQEACLKALGHALHM
ncbi:dihydrolipoyl dehydrogenase [Lentilitoribacter sp. EG35]|uniref:dihydrolipoyl dehydrogenase n=1 Tax=Lentilitoribacter sp. EG35 TaxID=3234192 RepID=UPI00345F46F2